MERLARLGDLRAISRTKCREDLAPDYFGKIMRDFIRRGGLLLSNNFQMERFKLLRF